MSAAEDETRVIVSFKKAAALEARRALHRKLGGRFLKTIYGAPGLEVVLFPAKSDVAALTRTYLESGLVDRVERDGVARIPEPPRQP